MMKVTIVGSGNVATVLGSRIKEAGHTIVQIYAHHHTQQSQFLSLSFGTPVITDFSQLNLSADIYLLAVSDHALPAVVQALPAVTGIVLHTAGSVSIEILKNTAGNYGVLYPLQSLRKEKADYNELPLLIDGNTKETVTTIKDFADTISSQVQLADDHYRLRLHTAAVVVSNFTNHLYSLAADFCLRENVDFTLLQPLITETAGRLRYFAPADMQTGPAIRKDVATITTHLQLLQDYPQLQKLYKAFTESIQEKTMNDLQ